MLIQVCRKLPATTHCQHIEYGSSCPSHPHLCGCEGSVCACQQLSDLPQHLAAGSCLFLCLHVCQHLCVYMCAGMCAGMCVCMCACMCAGMCAGMCRVGQNRISAPYMTISMVISLLKKPFVLQKKFPDSNVHFLGLRPKMTPPPKPPFLTPLIYK